MNESRLSALLLVATLTIALVVAVGPQRHGSAQVSPSPSLLAALAQPATSTTVTFGASLDLDGTTTSTALPRLDAPTEAPVKKHKKKKTSATTTTTTTVVVETTSPENNPTTTTAPPTTTTTQPAGAFNASFENQFGELINEVRTDAGKSGLNRDGSLDSEARKWAKKMAQSGDLTHSNLGRFLPPWGSAGENIAYGGSVSSIFGNLYDSSGHRGNMLGDYTHMGIGAWVDAGGTIWTCHVFAG